MLTHEEITRLSQAERLDLIGAPWNSLSDAETPATAIQTAGLRRRLESFERDRADAVGWEQLKAEIAKRTP